MVVRFLEVVGDGRPLLAHAQGHGFLGEIAFVDQALEAEGGLDGVEVLALDVFHDGHFQHGGVVSLADVGRHFRQPGRLRGPVAAFAADDLVAGGSGLPQGERLDDAQRPDRSGEFLQRFRVEILPGLVGVGDDLVERDPGHGGGIAPDDAVDLPGLFERIFTQQGAQASS